jgi:cytoskeletal protein CcmA (bactofilin family)
MAAGSRANFSINTIIGPGTHLRGNIEAAGYTRVDGSVLGDLKAQGRVVIGPEARLKSNVTGTFITVGGVVYGNVVASEQLTILSTALVIGDIITRRIQADEGCLIHGRVKVCQTDEAWEKALAEYQDLQGIRSALSFFPNHG